MLETKICITCKKELSLENFNKNKNTKDSYQATCKQCDKIRYKEWYNKNKDKKTEYGKQYSKENGKQYYEANKEHLLNANKKYRNKNKKKLKKYYYEYIRENKEKSRIKAQKYYAKKNNLTNTLSIEQWNEIKKAFDNKCAYCGKKLPLVQEHFIPVSNRGEYTHNNIIPSCKSCNSSKKDKDFFKWYPYQKSYSQERENKILKHLNYNKNKHQQLTLAI